MTWKLTVRGSPDRPIAAEYLCPLHGRFALDVERDANGGPPAEMPCPDDCSPVPGASIDYSSAMPLDLMVGPPEVCGIVSPYVISKQAVTKVRAVEVVRGGYQNPERPTWTDTTNLGEGQDLDDWHDDRDKVWERHREDEVVRMTKDLG